ncbi:MAG TPA: hypothetical protein VIE64_03870 [Solirubrobacterales bacterium]|jgi:hypothetical protein
MSDHQSSSQKFSVAEEEDILQQALLSILFVERPTQLTVRDLCLELRASEDFTARDAVDQAVRALVGTGLVHEHGPFVIPSRAAYRFAELFERI